jgi:hypothetical protein
MVALVHVLNCDVDVAVTDKDAAWANIFLKKGPKKGLKRGRSYFSDFRRLLAATNASPLSS